MSLYDDKPLIFSALSECRIGVSFRNALLINQYRQCIQRIAYLWYQGHSALGRTIPLFAASEVRLASLSKDFLIHFSTPFCVTPLRGRGLNDRLLRP